MNLREELEARGLVYQFTDEKLFDIYDQGGQKFYCGYDPTADSLHLGHFLSFMTAVNFMKRGNTFILIIGGATGMIGDPSGKDSERTFLDEDKLRHNQNAITDQVKSILENLKKISGNEFKFEVINNYDFYKDMSIFDFLRTVGKYITVNNMLSKESVKRRIENPESGISFTEFSYMLLQGNDFVELYSHHGVKLQIGGSDQRGNMVTGTEMIRKKLGGDHQGYVMTIPLMTDSTGAKFGKSAGNAIWLDPSKTSPYAVYQYFVNSADEDLPKYIKSFTLLSLEQIDKILDKHIMSPEDRYGQKELAKYVVQTVFGEHSSDQAVKISGVLFSDEDKIDLIKQFDDSDIQALYKEAGGITTDGSEVKVLDLFTQSGLTDSNGEAKKLLQQGGLYINEIKIDDPQKTINKSDFINSILLLRKGKKQFKVVKLA